MSLKWPPKDPDEVLDYAIDWSLRLQGDSISTSSWTLPDGLTRDSDTHDTASTIIWLSGGALGASYDVLNRIETAAGRTMDQTVKLKIQTR